MSDKSFKNDHFFDLNKMLFIDEDPKFSLSKDEMDFIKKGAIKDALEAKISLEFVDFVELNAGKATCMKFVVNDSNQMEVSISKLLKDTDGMEYGYDYGLGSCDAYIMKMRTDYEDYDYPDDYMNEMKLPTKKEIIKRISAFAVDLGNSYKIDMELKKSYEDGDDEYYDPKTKTWKQWMDY